MNKGEKGATDTIQAIKDIQTDFRLNSCQMLMTMCGDIGDVIQTCSDINVKSKLKLIECRNSMLSQVENIHQNEQKDSENAKKLIQKNKAYRRIRFNETELKMLEEVVELKNDPNNPNNKPIKSEKEKKKKNSKKIQKSFISKAGDEQNHKNYKEFVKTKHEEFNKKKSKIISEYKNNKSISRALPPITPRELENLQEITSEKNIKQIKEQTTTSQQLLSHSKQKKPVTDHNIQKKSSKRFRLGNSITLKGQMNELKKLKRMKLNNLNNQSKTNHTNNYDDNIYLPGQM
eukprot:513274_1